MFIVSKSNSILVKQAATAVVSRRSLSSTPVQRLYIQNNLHNDQTHASQSALDPNAKLYDFRSDTVTAPTDEMFEVMKQATRNDSVFEVSRMTPVKLPSNGKAIY